LALEAVANLEVRIPAAAARFTRLRSAGLGNETNVHDGGDNTSSTHL
jgi:hypothetical protein